MGGGGGGVNWFFLISTPIGFHTKGPLLETSIFPLSFQVVREPLPFKYLKINAIFRQSIYFFQLFFVLQHYR